MPKQFPQEPPLIYIQQPKKCFINPASHLDLCGLVRHDYLRQWNHGRHSLADFIQILITDFTETLPIFSLEKFNLPKRARENICDLLKQYPSFLLDLHEEDMLLVKGSMTLLAAGMSHTRRVDMWLPESFPTEPPLVYVHPSDGSTPTPGTEAYNQCNIDISYLRDWNYQISCLQVLMGVIQFECTPSGPIPPETISDMFSRAFRNILDDYLVGDQLIHLGEKLGQGEYGIVYKGTYDNPHSRVREDVAIKTLAISSAAESSVDSFVQEIIKMRPLKHRHIMELKGIALTDGKPCCIMPYMENGDLRSYVRNPQKTFYLGDLLTLALQVAKGMKYLAKHQFIHGDLAARNCLVDSCGTVKVSDFGLSRQLFQTDYFRFDPEKGQPVRWMAIEALTDMKYTRESDKWSFGVVLWELMTRGETPYSGMSSREVVFKVKNGHRLPRPDHLHQKVYDLMLGCWQHNGLRRPTFGEICTMITGWKADVRPSRPDRSPMDEVPAREVCKLPGIKTLDACGTRLNNGYLKPIKIGLGNSVLGQSNRTGPASCTHPGRISPNCQGPVSSAETGHTAGDMCGTSNNLGTRPGVGNRPLAPPPPPPRKGNESSAPVQPPDH